jgi:fatty acid-binding protein DegV
MNLGANIVLAGSKKKAKIHIPASVSGTMQSATLAAGDTKDLPIDLIDSQNGSVGIGLIALQAAETVKTELSKEEILKTRQKN